MKPIRSKSGSLQMAACVAPEDLNCGDFVAALNTTFELPSFLWCCDGLSLQPDEPVRMQFCAVNAGVPLKIKAICLPFIFARFPGQKSQILDVRQTQLVRLNRDYARAVWKEMKQPISA